MRYIIYTEDGLLWQANEITPAIKDACEQGIWDAVDTMQDVPIQIWHGEVWEDLPIFDMSQYV